MKWLLPAALGVLGGGVGGAVVATLLKSPEPAARATLISAPRTTPRPAITVIANDGVERRVEELERRLQAQAEERESAADDATDNEAAKRQTETPEAANSAVVERHRLFRAEHAAESRNGAWAANQESTVRTALTGVVERGGFTLVGVDCRTRWCRADVEWPSYAAALKGYGSLLASGLEGCESAILLDPAKDETRPYAASAFYDCAPDADPRKLSAASPAGRR